MPLNRVLLLLLLTACTPALDAGDAVFRCVADEDCDGNTICVGDEGDKQCVSQDGDCRVAGTPAPDGTECADEDGVDGAGVCVLGKCRAPECGDGFVTRAAGEECETAGPAANPFCNSIASEAACRFPVCGNGLRERGEACEADDPDCDACVTVCDGGVDAVDVDADPANGCEAAGTSVSQLPGQVSRILGVSGTRVYVSLGPQSPEDVGFFDVASGENRTIGVGVGGVVFGRGSTDDGTVLILSLNSNGPDPSDNLLKRIDGDTITDVATLGTLIPLAVAQKSGRIFVAAQGVAGAAPTLHEATGGVLTDLVIDGCDEPADLLVCGDALVCVSGTQASGNNFDAFARTVLLVDEEDAGEDVGAAAIVGCHEDKVMIDDRSNVFVLNDDGSRTLLATAPAPLSLRRLQDAVRPTLIGDEVLLHSGPAFDGPTLVRLDDGRARVIASDDPNGNGGLRDFVVVDNALYLLSDTDVRRVAGQP